MKKRITTELLDRIVALQKEGLSNNLIALRLGFHPSTLFQALRKAAFEKENKYRARKTVCSLGHPHPSALECSVCELQILRQRVGEIRNLKWQESVNLGFGVTWKVDWGYDERPNWSRAYAEAKGAETRDYKLKVRMWKEGRGPGPLTIWKGTAQKPMIFKIVIPEAK